MGTTSAGVVASAAALAASPERFWHHLLDKRFPGKKKKQTKPGMRLESEGRRRPQAMAPRRAVSPS